MTSSQQTSAKPYKFHCPNRNKYMWAIDKGTEAFVFNSLKDFYISKWKG